MRVGIRLGSLGTGSLKKDLQRSLAMGVHGVQLRVADTEIDPRELSGSGREELADYIESFGFELPALSGELGGFADPRTADERVCRTQSMIDLCVALHSPLLCIDAGALPAAESPQYGAIAGAVRALAAYALDRDVRIAIGTGPETIDRIAAFIADLKSEGARLNYAPANLCRNGIDPLAGVRAICTLIAHVQVCGATRGEPAHPGNECAFTQGDAAIKDAVSLLGECGYDGYLTVSWERDEELASNAVEAVTWLKRQDGVDP